MDLNFINDPGLVPRPRSEIRIQSLKVQSYPDGRRMRVEIEVTAFAPSDRPSIELSVHRADSTEVASLNIVETMHRTMALTVHLRQSDQPEGSYTFQANLYYEPGIIQHSFNTKISLPEDIPTPEEK